MTTKPVEPKLYRDAMARYAGHVQLLTTAFGKVRRGVTVTAACSVSDNPGTVLVCLNHSNPLNTLYGEAGAFALNTLSADHESIADAFSGKTGLSVDERFAAGEWETISTGAPALVGALAVFDCRLIDSKTIATHTVLFGEVTGLRLGEPGRALMYMDRGYHAL